VGTVVNTSVKKNLRRAIAARLELLQLKKALAEPSPGRDLRVDNKKLEALGTLAQEGVA